MSVTQEPIGRVTRCSSRGFVGAVRLPEPDLPAFGGFCRAETQHGQARVIGLIYDMSIEDDELARQMAAADDLSPEQLADAQTNRQVPLEFSALTIGFARGETFYYSLPPQPPLTLAPIYPMAESEVHTFTERFDFLPLIFGADRLPVDDLVAAALRQAALTYPENQRQAYLIQAGRECARFMAADLNRLENLIRGLQT
jgi:hypothetical protein